MKLFSPNGNFPLVPGTGIIQVPSFPLIRRRSQHAQKFPKTPDYYLLERSDGKPSSYYFMQRPQTRNPDHETGLHLFVPADTKVGNYLVIEWREPKCACARFATATEIEEAKANSEKKTAAPYAESSQPDDRRLLSRGSM
ncbi:MAG: hypothetical protein NT034_04795 [Candidatus Magasanikbacteria bacterium]|nr:hypothetical protein [Candidatus Magasanikbacteria bacterium]